MATNSLPDTRSLFCASLCVGIDMHDDLDRRIARQFARPIGDELLCTERQVARWNGKRIERIEQIVDPFGAKLYDRCALVHAPGLAWRGGHGDAQTLLRTSAYRNSHPLLVWVLIIASRRDIHGWRLASPLPRLGGSFL